MKKILLAFGLVAVALLALLVVRAWRFASRQVRVEPAPPAAVDAAGAAARLAQALRIRTISRPPGEPADSAEFVAFRHFLEVNFPRAHAALSVETVAGHSLLYAWKGSDEVLPPVVLLAHTDVVPVEPGTEGRWTHPPFDGHVGEGFVWGRGALDDKLSVVGIFEAVELLLAEGFRPRRTLLVALGHDEEVGGAGAAAVARLLGERGVRPEFVLDEGGFVTEGVVPGVSAPVALVATGEKGYMSVELTVEAPGGHSSSPPPQTAVGVLSAAVARLEANPLPASLDGAPRELLEYVGPEMSFGRRLVTANLWLFGPLVRRQLEATPAGNASVRTTTAATVFEGGVKDNVLPTRARAVVNFRIRPGETNASVLEHIRRVIDDPRVRVETYGPAPVEPSPRSDTGARPFGLLERTIRQTFPDALVAPFVTTGATDARHYAGLTPNVYRFLPARVNAEDIRRLHGADERLGVEAFAQVIRFYRQLILNADAGR